MPRTLPLAALALAVPLLVTTARADHWNKTYEIAKRPELSLHTDDASVRFVIREGSQVTIRVTTSGLRIGRQVQIIERQDGDRIDFEVREPRFGIFFVTHPITIEIETPAGIDLDVVSGDGSVDLPALKGRLSIQSGDGRVRLEDSSGEIELTSGDGSLIALGVRGSLEARTGDGRIEVSGRFDRLRLGSGDGPIVAKVLTGSRPTGPWSITTGDGSVMLRVPRDFSFDLDAEAGDGTVIVDLPVQIIGRIQRRSIRGTVNGGGATVRLRTGDGRISVGTL